MGELSWAGEDGQHSFGYSWLGMSRKPRSDNGPHGATRSSDQLHQIVSELKAELRRLTEQPAAEQDFERLAGEVHQLFAAAERAALAHELERLAVDRPETDPR